MQRPHQDERFASALGAAAAEFINRESNRSSLITVTRVEVVSESKKAHIYVSVYPPHELRAVIDFLSRQRQEFLRFMRTKTALHMLPYVDFLPDPDIGVDGNASA